MKTTFFPSIVRQKITVLVFILLITFFAFYPSLRNGFFNWDDSAYLTENETIRSLAPENIHRMFSAPVQKTYVPLTLVSYAIEYHFFKYNPFVYHFNNLFLHLSVVALIFVFALQCGLSLMAASCAALLFGIHPMHVESVVWVTERKDLLYALFYMLALCCYWKYLKSRHLGTYFLTIVFGLLSILAKPMALSLPLVLFVCDWLYKRKFDRWLFIDKLPHLFYIVPIAWMTYSLHARVPGHNFSDGILIWIWTFTFYLQKFIWPSVIILPYQLPKPIDLFSVPYLSAISLLFMVLFLLLSLRKNRWIVFAFLFYFVSIFFLLRYDDLKDAHIVANRFMYLPSLGICFLFGAIIDGLIRKQKYVTMIAVIFLIGILGAKTYFLTTKWKDSWTWWNYVLKQSPNEEKAYSSRGMVYAANKEYSFALADYDKALQLNPDYAVAYYNRGNIYRDQGHYDLAISDYTKAIENDPSRVDFYQNRAACYFKKEEFDLAEKDLTMAITVDPHYAKSYYNRSILYQTKNDFKKALADALQAKFLGYPKIDDRYISELKVRAGL